jgi:hypothetical protein
LILANLKIGQYAKAKVGASQLSGGVLHRCGLRVWSELDAQKTRIFGQF